MDSLNIKGENNNIYIIKDGVELPYEEIKGLTITITGNNNTVKIGVPTKFIGTTIVMNGDNNSIEIKPTHHRYIRHTSFGMENGGIITVGEKISVYRQMNVVAKDGKRIDIGNECMFAREIMIRNNDGHIIVDMDTNEVINPTEDIYIGNRVWVGARAMILKGAYISDGSVVGAMSLVNKKFDEENILIAGVPAKKLRSNIKWLREDYTTYLNKNSINSEIE